MNPAPTLPAYTDDSLARLGVTELTELMIRDEDRVPRNVIDRCAAHGEEMVGHLRTAFEADDAWRPELPLGEWWLRLHAVMILGLIASESAGLLLVQLMRQMSLAQDGDLQDWLAGHWPALFRNKPLPAVERARALGEDRALDWYIRCQGADVVVDASTRESGDALDSALDWIARIAADEGEDWYMRLAAGNTLLDFPRERHRPLLNDLAARQKGPGAQFSREAVEEACAKGYDEPDWKRFKDPWKFYTPGAIARRQDRWAEEADTDGDEPGVPYVRPTGKIGRNDPCPCGSGRKYKKCCLPRESA